MAVIDLIDAIRSTSDIDQKFEHVVKTLSTAATANLNATLVLLDVLNTTPGFDKEALKKKLLELRDEPPVNGDIHGSLYSQLITLVGSRLG